MHTRRTDTRRETLTERGASNHISVRFNSLRYREEIMAVLRAALENDTDSITLWAFSS
jgi:hypothetical protein